MPKRSVNGADEYIGKQIRSRRLFADMSQEELGAALGVTFQQIQKYEKGVNRVSTATLMLIGQSLKCDPSELMPPPDGRRHNDPEAIELQDFMATREGIAIARAFKVMSEDVRSHFVKLAQKVAATA